MDVNTLSASFDPSGIESGAGRGRQALEALKAASLQTASAFDALEASSPKRTQSAVRELANAVKGSFSQMEQAIKPMSAAIATMQKELEGLAVDAAKSGKKAGANFAAGLKDGADQAVITVRSEVQKVQAEYEAMRALNARFKPGALENLKASGVRLSATDDAQLFMYQTQRKFDAALDAERIKSENNLQRVKEAGMLDRFKRGNALDGQLYAEQRSQEGSLQRMKEAGLLDTFKRGMALDAARYAEQRALEEKAAINRAYVQTRAATAGPVGSYSTISTMATNIVRNQDLDMVMPPKALFLESAAAIKQAELALKGVGSTADGTAHSIKALTGHTKDMHSAARGLASGLNAMWLTWGNILPLLAGATLSNAFVKAIKTGTEFEQTLTAIRELAQVSTKDMAKLSEEVLRLGSTTQFGPLEVAGAMKELALAGLDAKQQLEAVRPLLDFSVVGELPLDKAAKSLVSISTAYGYSATGFSHVGDVIAKTAAVTMSSVTDMTEAFRTASVIAQQFKVNINDSAAVLGLMSQVGIRGSQAGVALRNMYSELLGASKDTRTLLREKLGVDIIDNATRSVKPLTVIFGQLGEELSKLDTRGQLDILEKLGGKKGGKSLSAVLTAAVTEVGDAGKDIKSVLGKLQQDLIDAPGFVAMAAVGMAGTTKNQLKILGNEIETSLITAFQAASPAIQQLTLDMKGILNSQEFQASVTSVVSGVAHLVGWLTKHATVLSEVAAALVIYAVVMAAATTATAAMSVAAPMAGRALGALMLSTSAAAGAQGALATASAVTGTALAGLSGVLWPLTAALAVAGAAWYLMKDSAVDAARKMRESEQVRVATTLDGIDREIERLQTQIKVRNEGANASQVAAAVEAELVIQRLRDLDKLELAEARAAHSKLESRRSSIVSGGATGFQRERLSVVDAQLKESKDAIEAITRRQAQVEESALAKIAKLKSLAKQDAEEAEKAAAASGKRPAGVGTYNPDEPRAGRIPTGLKLAQDATNDILKLYRGVSSEAEREAAHASRMVDYQYSLGVMSFKDAEAEKELIRRNALTSSKTMLRLEIEAAEAGAKRVREAAEAANGRKPGSVKPEEVAHKVEGFTSRVEEARRAIAKLDEDGEAAAMEALVKRSRGLIDAVKASETLRDTAAVELTTVREESAQRLANLGLSQSAAAVEAARYKEAQKFLKAELALRSEVAKFKEGDSVAALDRAKAELKKLEDSKPGAVQQAGDIVASEQDKVAAYKADPFNGMKKALEDYHLKVKDVAASTQSLMTKAFQGMEDALVSFTKTGKLDFSSLADSIIADMLRIGIQQNVMGPLSALFSSGAANVVQALFSANGNAFDSGGLVPFAKGGVFDSPTAFGFGGGKLGVLGEDGAEAVMPLTRGSDGKLGVAGGGGANVNVTVNVIEDSSKAGTQSRRDGGNGDTFIDVFVEKVKSAIAGDISKGSGAVPSALASTYGLNRTVGSY